MTLIFINVHLFEMDSIMSFKAVILIKQSAAKCFSTACPVHAPVLLNIPNSLRKSNKMLGKFSILPLFPNKFNNFNKTIALMEDPQFLTWH